MLLFLQENMLWQLFLSVSACFCAEIRKIFSDTPSYLELWHVHPLYDLCHCCLNTESETVKIL